MARLLTIDDFIGAEIVKPFAFGATDCAATADRWARLVLGRSPAEAAGFAWGTKDEAERLQADVPLHIALNRAMKAAGCPRTEEPQPGDIGLVFTERGKLCVAIFTGRLWFSRDEDGLIGVPPRGLWKAWSVRRAQDKLAA